MHTLTTMRIVIIGGGAAGFLAAITAAEHSPESEIIILEKNRTVLNKVRISGGGRCNVTHACFDNRLMVKNYPRGERFLKQLLPQFDVQSTIDWFAARNVIMKTEGDGRMFPVSNSSETIVNCLMSEARKNGVQVRTSTAVKSFCYQEEGRSFDLNLTDNTTLAADRLLIASGGYPKLESFTWLAEHAHEVEPPVPSLFTFNAPGNYLLPLSGVSVQDAGVKIMGTKLEWRGPVLITHWGFSGPAVLKLSAWGARVLADKQYVFCCRINWVPGQTEAEVRERLMQEKAANPKQMVATYARFGLPLRLWRAFLENSEIDTATRWAEISNKSLNRLTNSLTNSQFDIHGKSTYKEEFVTAGGVALHEVNQTTLESSRIPGLYFAGEVLNVDGITGGFNFQNAWTTGYIAGKNIALD
ncbi:NAD(P)/FAD-dependent oxidoreductase [Persicitalea jodogahamensis]|uniref:Flavoprotein n=1 Tax=Persicitalea jodogahamensis TaxID=402147 RepID=A0A8J3D562_9BACT|nr:NAD(P)/FAD-dependent oxidoreductase [Persicitalea jodogahamensis]GHB75979.1 flavoprotein [Persicitalea jodogahamensis]